MKKAVLIWFLTSFISGFVAYFTFILNGHEDHYEIIGCLAISLVIFLSTFYSPFIINKSYQLIKSKPTTPKRVMAIIISYVIIVLINPFSTIIILNTLGSNETSAVQFFLYMQCIYAFIYHTILIN